MNTKALLAATLLTALFAGQSAMAEDAGFDAFENFEVVSTEIVIQKASLQSTDVETDYSEGANR